MSQPERAVFCPLCLRLIPESSWTVLSMEDAPPKQYGTARERCLTCKACNNGPGGDFEKRAHDLNDERAAAIKRATRPNPLFASAPEALRLATVSPDERLLEIKSSYIIASVTLGLSYMRAPGLDQVRELIASGKPESAATCGTFPTAEISDGDWVLVAHEPIDCIIVTHHTNHSHRPVHRHAVFLPMPNSEPGFYRRLGLLRNKANWRFAERYEQPPARRFPRHWDRNGSEHGFRVDREIEVGLLATSCPGRVGPMA